MNDTQEDTRHIQKENEIPRSKAYFLLGFLALAIVFTSAGVSKLASSWGKNVTNSLGASIVTSEGFIKKTDFPNTSLSGKAAVVYDLKKDEVLFGKNAEAQLPLASLNKIMVALTARDLLPENAKVSINLEYLREDGDNGFRDGQEWKLKDILDATLVESSNDGAAAIAGAYAASNSQAQTAGSLLEMNETFVSAMNKKAKDLGLTQTYFLNETGLDTNSYTSGGYGSAIDVAKLFSFAVKKFPTAFEATKESAIVVSSVGKTRYVVANTNPVVEKIPGIIASKTGYTDLAGGNVVVLFDVGPMHPVAVVVLGSTREGRFTDLLALVDATLLYITDGEN